jgi:hypothetical protein
MGRSVRRYQPQQSVLKRHFGQRHTACMRYIALPQRSQAIGAPSLPVRQDGSGVPLSSCGPAVQIGTLRL